MKHQIFKTIVPTNIFLTFLLNNAEEHQEYFLFSKSLYKKSQFHNCILPFIDTLEPYYHDSKKYYIKRKMNFNNFITIIRQICNSNNISFSTKLTYQNSTYEIIYIFYKSNELLNVSQTSEQIPTPIIPQ
jgi:hypothetical protein